MRPPAIARLENPRPRPPIFQSRVGPPLGQAVNSPVSFDIPSRLGPRHCGHSTPAPPLFWGRLSAEFTGAHFMINAAANARTTRRVMTGWSSEGKAEAGPAVAQALDGQGASRAKSLLAANRSSKDSRHRSRFAAYHPHQPFALGAATVIVPATRAGRPDISIL